MNEYVDIDTFKATLELTSTSYADDDAAQALEAASRGIDSACGRWFYRTDASNDDVRYYRPTRYITLTIDDLIGLTSVEVDQSGDGTYEQEWTLNTDFVLEPDNAELDGRPWERIRLHPRGRYPMPVGIPRAVKITGQFGWLDVPPTIVTATSILAAKLIKRKREAPFAIAFSADSAMRIAVSDPDVMFLIEDFTRKVVL